MNDMLIMKKDETIKELLESRKLEIQQLLPENKDVNRFIKSALLAIARDYKLQKCTVKSLFTAVVNAAETGLDFTPTKGHAYLIPFGDAAIFMPGYQGFVYLMVSSGVVSKIEARLVYEKDKFAVYYGTNPQIKHEPEIYEEPGNVVGAYAVAWFPDGTSQFEYMRFDEIEKIRERSKAKSSGPWVTDTGEMQRKTVVRRLRKYISSESPQLDTAFEHDNASFGLDTILVNPKSSRTSDLVSIISEKEQNPDEQVEIEILKPFIQSEKEHKNDEQLATPKQTGSIYTKCIKEYGLNHDQALKLASQITKKTLASMKELTIAEASWIIDTLEQGDTVKGHLKELSLDSPKVE